MMAALACLALVCLDGEATFFWAGACNHTIVMFLSENPTKLANIYFKISLFFK
jgi:hypothetical protein